MNGDPRRWVVLTVGLLGLIAGCAAQYGIAYLIPAFRAEGLALETASLLVSAPLAGILCTLIAWGAAADRWGERRVLVIGLAGAGLGELGAAAVGEPLARGILLFAVGATSSAIHAASGRLILGWFGARERGLAMGIRQTGLPLGVGLAAVVLPQVAAGGGGIAAALSVLGVACLATAVLIALMVRDPHRSVQMDPGTTAGTPYREPFLWRIHGASALLVIPQYAVAVFAFDYLVNALGWSLGAAGLLLGATQLGTALTRLGIGWWSDRMGSRLRPMRWIALGIGLVMACLSGLALAGSVAVVVALTAAAAVTGAPNGVAFTAVAERAGPRWAGRALGIQNTFQNLVATAVPVPLALLIGAAGGRAYGYALAFTAVVAFPFVAAVVIPTRDEWVVE